MDQYLPGVLLFSTLVEPKIRHKAIKDDPDDNKIIDCGVAARADCIISQDKHLLNLKEFLICQKVRAGCPLPIE